MPIRRSLRYLSAVIILLCTHPASAGEDPQAAHESAISRRLTLESETHDNPFAITPHKPTYVLPIAYNSRPNESWNSTGSAYQNTEMKFQVSLKMFLARNLFERDLFLSFGYTNTSWWQSYNSAISAPFRETNHEPELMLTALTNYSILGLNARAFTLGLSHQSNGRSDPESRSWNRLYAQLVFERDNLYFSLKPWWRIPEPEKISATMPGGDDNPDIDDYMGNFEFSSLYYLGQQTYGLMLRNNLQGDNRGAIQFDWTFPLSKRVRGYVQYFNGYGESLIDYDHYSNRLGAGVMLTNWL